MIPIPAKYRKFIAALVGATLAIIANHSSGANVVSLDIIAVATALGVYAVPNAK